MTVRIIPLLLGLFLGLSRVLYAAYKTIPLEWVLFCTLPNAICYIVLVMIVFRMLYTFYLIFYSNALFMTAKLKSLAHRNLILSGAIVPRKFEHVVNRNLSHLDEIIRNFKLSQNDFDYTVCAYNSGMYIVLFTSPYVFFFQTDDWFSKLFCGCLYAQSMLLAVYTIIAANVHLDKGFLAYGRSVFHLVPRISKLSLKIKLENFLSVHQKDNLLSYRFLSLFYYNNSFMLRVCSKSLELRPKTSRFFVEMISKF